ncbi:hypothetical protein TUM4644_26250 [Shewanella colwelliana]|uniref:DUF7661 domain-containing protein n=2 Tax=Shewanella colwelliana TaxID=23 RepID=A0ABQ4NU78_SHECO|nr:hypothetical protein [Shewanella colwelliana]MDX1280240.1 hypothetical protein [Shewanella colwelliana]GIU28524.1 hypothetical protein TUM4644_26250 [Shewanella colwelliana]GIU34917.1 hypothetical protein TUM3794_01940 [Shewanella colwelliana]
MAKFDVFGTTMIITRRDRGWMLAIESGLGMRRPVTDVVIAHLLVEAELAQYLADIYHESASIQHPDVIKLA